MSAATPVGQDYVSLGSYLVGAVHTSADLVALRDEWNALLARRARPSLFLSWDWMNTWWEVFQREDHRLWVLCARQPASGELVGIAPLVMRPQSGPLATWRALMILGRWESYHLDFIVRPGEEAPVADAFMRYLRQRSREWDLLELAYLDSSSPCLEGLLPHGPWYAGEEDVYIYVEFDGSWDDYWMRQSSKHRNTLTRRERHLRRDYPDREIAYHVHRQLDQGQRVFEVLMELMRQRWAAEGDTPEQYFGRDFARFTRASAELASRLGLLRLYSLWVGDHIVSAELILMEEGSDTAHFYRTVMDYQWSQYSVGMLLFNYVLKDLMGLGVRRLELGDGITEQKLRYGTGQHSDVTLRTGARREVQLWLQSMETGRSVWRVVKKALPANARQAIRRALGRDQAGAGGQPSRRDALRQPAEEEVE